MKTIKRHSRWLASICLLTFLAGCTVREFRQLPEGEPIPVERMMIILHTSQSTVVLVNVQLLEDSMAGDISDLNVIEDKEREVHITTYEDFTYPADALRVIIPFESMKKVERWELNKGKTYLYSGLVILGITLAAAIAAVLVIVAFKESCPFIYTWNGESFELTGEIFSGAVYPPLERDDYLCLPALAEEDGECRIKIVNEVKHEIQHTNLVELLVIDHEEGTQVLADKYGRIHAMAEEVTPAAAVDGKGRDILEKLAVKDNSCFTSELLAIDSTDVEEVFLTFPRRGMTDSASLRIRARNTLWLDITYREMFSRFGNLYPVWKEQKKHESAARLQEWTMNQGIPLAVYLWKEGGWQLEDHFNIAGPLAMKDDVLPLDISGVEGEDVRVKLEFGFLFWEIDYAAVDYSSPGEHHVTRILPSRAVDPERGDVTGLLSAADSLYYDQPRVGDEAEVVFTVPDRTAGSMRSYILHSRGHYETIIDADGEPDVEFLTEFRRPGRFREFARELFTEKFFTSDGKFAR